MVTSINSQNVGEERGGSLTLASVLWYETFQSKRSDNIKYIGEYRNSRYVTVIPKLVRVWIGVVLIHRIQSADPFHARSGLLVYI